MGIVESLILIAIISVIVYLLFADTDFAKIVKQRREIAKLRTENNRLKESNAELREEYNNYLILKYKYKSMLVSTKSDLEHIQEINTTNMTDKEIIHERYIATENLLKDINSKIKELDCLTQPNSN